MKNQTKCNHHFWKDKNPPNCLNCGKTQKEITQEIIDDRVEKALKQTQKKWYDAGYDIGFVDGTEKACREMLVEERECGWKSGDKQWFHRDEGFNKCCAKQRELEKLIKDKLK